MQSLMKFVPLFDKMPRLDPGDFNRQSLDTKIIAHRGASSHSPENTMAAFEKAVEMKADYIELDVQMSRDGRLVVMHDCMIDRTTNGSGKISDLTWPALKKLDNGSWFNPPFTGERIPGLEEVLERFLGRIGILIELKNPLQYPRIEKKLAELLMKKRAVSLVNHSVIVQSFDRVSIRKFHDDLPSIPVGILINKRQRVTVGMLREFAGYAHYVNPYRGWVNAERVRRIHRFGMKAMAWTVSRRKEMAPLLRAGVDGIITNDPGEML
ncbi:MAG TPA: glycerophosphodiester phosphodiesterase family protein [Bacillales bacterium]|nr:glycerophosphodiester phosphodiesterase family protein [Bacillales bacterium]